MRLFIDSSQPNLWERYSRRGWLYGATTNPLVLQREGRGCDPATYRELVASARSVGLKELHIQATGSNAADLMDSGLEIAGLWSQLVVKVPLTQPGTEAAAGLIGRGVRVTLTAAYAAHQMIAACAMGAAYLAPYYGRLLESGGDADRILNDMVRIRNATVDAPQILVASLRTIAQLESLSACGHDTFTLGPDLAELFASEAMSDRAASEFERACETEG